MAVIDEERTPVPRRDEDVLTSVLLTKMDSKVRSVHRFMVSLIFLIVFASGMLVWFGRLWQLPRRINEMNTTVAIQAEKRYAGDSLLSGSIRGLGRAVQNLEYRICAQEQQKPGATTVPVDCAKEVFLRPGAP